nr:unnamed protein product [Spirometra erinaceieuropaei]
MWLAVGIFLTSIIWITVQGQGEVLENGLPVSCGIPAGPQPPADKHERLKTESKIHSWPWHAKVKFWKMDSL